MNTNEVRVKFEKTYPPEEGIEYYKTQSTYVCDPEDPFWWTEEGREASANYNGKWTAYQQATKESEAALISMGYGYQHEETGVMGTVDSWQVENGFFKTNPKLVNCGEVFRKEADR